MSSQGGFFLLGLYLMGFFVKFYVCCLLKRGGCEKSALALGSSFTPLSCYWFIYLWSESLPCLLWNMYRKWDPCLCSQALSASIRVVQTVAGTFSTVCSSSTHIFHLLWKFKFHRLGVANSFFLHFILEEGRKAQTICQFFSRLHLTFQPKCNNKLINDQNAETA